MRKRYNYAIWDNGSELVVGLVTGGDPLSVTLQPMHGDPLTVPRSQCVTRNGHLDDVKAAHIVCGRKA